METMRLQVIRWPDPMFMVNELPIIPPMLSGSMWGVEQELPFRKRIGWQQRVAELKAMAMGSDWKTMRLRMEMEIRLAYTMLWSVQEETALFLAWQQQLKTLEEALLASYETGMMPQQQVLKLQVERHMLGLKLERLQEEKAEAMGMILSILNRPSPEGLQGRYTLDAIPWQHENPDSLYLHALRLKPEGERIRLEQSRIQVQGNLERSMAWPMISVKLMAQKAAPIDHGGGHVEVPTDMLMLGVSFKIPIDRTRIQAAIEENRLRERQSEWAYQSFQSDLRAKIQALYAQWQAQRAQWMLLHQTLIPLAQTAYDAALATYSTGKTDVMNLMEPQEMLFELRMERIETEMRMAQTSAKLLQEIGFSPAINPEP